MKNIYTKYFKKYCQFKVFSDGIILPLDRIFLSSRYFYLDYVPDA